jgi:preprotein translocase subunit SecD
MKTLKYILLGVVLSSLVFSSFAQSGTVTFNETYTQQEVISKLDQDDQFFTWVQMEDTDPESSRIGRCHQDNLEDLWTYIQSKAFRAKVQEDLSVAAGTEAKDQMISLYAIKKNASNNMFPSGQDLEEVSVSLSDDEENYMLLFSFSESGTEKWASMTRLNKERDIAILFDGKVISAPRVREEIKDGKCAISGNYTESEINELKAVFEN